MTKPAILFLIPGLNVGGAERHTLDLRLHLDQRGFRTGLLVHGPRRSQAMVKHPGAHDAVLLDLKGMSDPVGWLRVRAAIRQFKPDLIVGVNQMPLIVAVATKLMGGTSAKVACIFHTTVLRQSELSRLFLFRWALRLADALVFVSANQKAYWIGNGLRCARAPVILNGVDLAQFEDRGEERAAIRARFGFASTDIVTGIVAAFRPEKSHDVFIAAMARLREQGRPFKALLVGDGPMRVAIEQAADDHGVRDHVVFAGEQADVRGYMAACDLGVLCSVAVETFSLSAIEFLAMGVPMIMSRVGGAVEIVEDGVNGFLFKAGDVDDFADRLEQAAEPATLARLTAGARPSMRRLSIGAMVDQYTELVTTLYAAR